MLLHLTLPLSIAASWAWGTSLIVGMQIAQEKGFIAWLIWATANCLTLVLFGELTRRGFLTRSVFEHRVVKWMALAVQIFCLVVNLNILNEIAIRRSDFHSLDVPSWTLNFYLYGQVSSASYGR